MTVERDVVYRLRTLADEQNRKILQNFQKQLTEPYDALQRKIQSTNRIQADAARTEANRIRSTAELRSRTTKDTVKEQEQAERERRKQIKETASQHERALSDLRGSQDKMREALISSTDAIAKFGRGFAALGLVGEENTKKLIEGLVKIQATFDLVTGGVEAYVRLTEAVRAYRGAVIAAAAAEEAAARSRALSTGVSAAAGRGGGRAGGALLTAGSAAGGTALASGGGGLFSAIGGAATAAAPFAGGAAVGAGLGAGLIVMAEQLSGANERLGTFTHSLGEAAVSMGRFFSGIQRSLGLPVLDPVGVEGIAASEQGVQRTRAFGERQRQLQGVRQSATAQLLQQRLETIGLDPTRSRLGIVTAQASAIRSRFAQGGLSEQDRAEFERQLIELTRERLSLEKQAAATRTQAAERSLNLSKQELQTVQQKLQAERGRLQSAAERFGQLSPLEQSRLIALKQRADRGEDVGIAGFRALAGVGTEEAAGLASEAFRERARAGRFFDVFGGREESNIRRLEGREGELRAEVDLRRNVVVNIEDDTERTIDLVVEEIMKVIDARSERIRDQIEQNMARNTRNIQDKSRAKLLEEERARRGGE